VSAQDEGAEQFRLDLIQLRQMAGIPSYSALETASRHRLKRATVSDVLGGKRVKLPDWPFVSAFVAACRQLAEDNRLDSADLGTVADWKRHWDTAVAGHIGTRFPGRGLPADPPTPSAGESQEMTATPLRSDEAIPPPPADSLHGTPVIGGEEPSPTSDFVGRADLLATLHASLTGEGRTRALVLQGLSGVGKTQLAREYAHRYAAQYDLIWWIRCDSADLLEQGLSELEAQLHIAKRPALDEKETFADLFRDLRLGRPYVRWLLIYDNANEPEQVRALIPPGQGSVLITSRNVRWDAYEATLELDVFERRESVELLRSRMHWLNEAGAQRLADAVGDLPLALEHIIGSNFAVDDYITKLKSDPIGLFSTDQPAPYQATVAQTWGEMLQRLNSDNSDALDLLSRLAFFGIGAIPQESLEQGRLIQEISLHPLLSDAIRRGRAISALARAGLVRINNAERTLSVHGITQSIVRAMLTHDQRERCRHDVHLLLAAADPGNPDDSDNWPRYNGLRDHMSPSNVEGCHNVAVRRLIVNFVSYLRAAGDPKTALDLVNRALSHQPRRGVGHGGGPAPDFSLSAAKVEILLSLGRKKTAFTLSRDVLNDMKPLPEQWSVDIAILNRATGAELRMQGRFSAALSTDTDSAERHIYNFGHDHPQTFIAISNQATDLALSGDYNRSIRLAEGVYRSSREFYNRADHPCVLFYQNALSRYQRIVGQYHQALDLAETVCEEYRSAVRSGALTADHPWILEHQLDHAAAQRDMRLMNTAELSDLEVDVSRVRNKFWETSDVASPQTLNAAVILGSLKLINGRTAEAVREVSRATELYRSELGAHHPYTYACAAFLASMHRLAGAPDEGAASLRTAIEGLTSTIGDDHPLTLAAVTALVNTLIDAGAPEAALDPGHQTLDRSRRVLGSDHPHTLACAVSVVAVLSALGRQSEAAQLRTDTQARYVRTLGDEHPNALLFAAGELLDPFFTPIPL
jgi:hypothetical protein